MKKFIAVLLVGLLLIGSAGTIFAKDSGSDNQAQLDQAKVKAPRLIFLKEFQNEYHQINQLHKQRLELRMEVIDKHDRLIDLLIAAKENKNKEVLAKAKEVKQEINSLNDQITSNLQQIKQEKASFRAEIINKNIDTAREHLTNIITLLGNGNDLVTKKLALLDQVINILSNSDTNL